MDIQLVASENIKTLEQYAISLVVGMFSLKTLEEYHRHADNGGIFDDTESTQARLIIGRFRELQKLYQNQLEACLERIPEELDVRKIIADMQKQVTKKRKKKEKPTEQ